MLVMLVSFDSTAVVNTVARLARLARAGLKYVSLYFFYFIIQSTVGHIVNIQVTDRQD